MKKSATFSCSKPDIKTKRVMNRTGFITLFGTREGIRIITLNQNIR
nr:MAG TPA: hypothetical protein [Caudoviricetes sp.]